MEVIEEVMKVQEEAVFFESYMGLDLGLKN